VLFASLKLGATFMPLNFRLSRREVDVLLRRGGPAVLFHSERYTELLSGVVEAHDSLEALICLERDFEALLAEGAETEPEVERPGAEEIAILAFTSGTTGLPKGVQTSHRMTAFVATTQLLEFEMRRRDLWLTSSPLFHSAGYFQVLMCAYLGCRALILPQFDPVEVQAWLARPDGPTAVFMVPTMLNAVLAVPGARDASYDQVRLIGYGAAPMSPALLRDAMDVFGCDFVNNFGAGTENGSATTLTAMDHRRAAAGDEYLLASVGRAAAGVELRICDENLNVLGPGEVGEIVTRNNTTMSGYLAMPDKSARSLPGDGWFRAGDLGYLDEEGFLFLAGRSNDMIIRGGENVYPLEIEHVLAEHEAVLEVAVVGVEDEHWGQAVRAWVVLREDGEASADELKAHCDANLGRYKVPTEYWFVDELPKNASGKILKRELVTWLPEAVGATGATF
jgi:acyl-CoA synthetase (AMP-forming)/AMP-acid ligase II